MPKRPPKKLFPNPFYVLLLVASVVFVVTTLGYLVGPTVQEQAAKPDGGPASLSVVIAKWLDRNAPLTLAIEFVVMLTSALLAMATDRWFPAKPAKTDVSTV